MLFQLLILSFNFSRARFNKRSSSQLPEVERGTAGGGERGTLPSGPLNIAEGVATASQQDEVATASKQDDPANHAPLGAEEKVQ